MQIVIIIILTITVILLTIRLCKSRKSNKKNMEYISRLRDIIEAQRETAEMGELLIAENERLLAELSIKSNWTIGVVPKSKEPNQNTKE